MFLKSNALLLIIALLLSACGGLDGQDEDEEANAHPRASAINTAAARAAAFASATIYSSLDETPPVADSEKPAAETPTSTPGATETPTAEMPTGTSQEMAAPALESPAEELPTVIPAETLSTNRRVEVGEIESFPQLLPFDGIRPVYEPRFATAEEAPLDADELVIGMAMENEAKAYPISVLRFREMVNDEMAGIPTLVTW